MKNSDVVEVCPKCDNDKKRKKKCNLCKGTGYLYQGQPAILDDSKEEKQIPKKGQNANKKRR